MRKHKFFVKYYDIEDVVICTGFVYGYDISDARLAANDKRPAGALYFELKVAGTH